MTTRGQRSAKDLPYLDPEATREEIVKHHNELISDYRLFNKNVSLQSNFNCQILDVEFAAGETKTLSHSLGVIPLYRIILRQTGNGVLSDIPSGWNKHQITFKNEGAVRVTATIMLVRE